MSVGLVATGFLGVYSLWRFGTEQFIPRGGRIGLPLIGYFDNFSVGGWLLALAAATTVVIGARRRDWTWVVVGVFVLSFGTEVTENPINAWRAAGLVPVLWAFGPGYRAVRDSGVVEVPAAEVSA